ncbi:uncharacterized protein LOC128244545 [Mya arenaria]|uniref:uncharacterized protein LOC128244545 n=1 Tax=Mya arenaria TaxID=6604 RepID=UPI0022E01500|nr:uncharacterized protein LOC128244545 [Mya arenaria]
MLYLYRVNSVGGHGRDAGEVKKKWIDLKSVVKKKVMGQLHGHKQTGGGEPIEMNIKDWEEKVLATIPKVSVSGIEGGIDTSEQLNGIMSSEVPATSLEVKTGEVSSPEGTGSDITPGPSSTAKRKLEEPGKSEKKKKKMEEEDLSLRMVLAQEQTNSILKEISNSLKEIVNLKRGEQQFSVFEQ